MPKLSEVVRGKSDAGRAGFRPSPNDYPVKNVTKEETTVKEVKDLDPWDGKKRLDAGPKVLRVLLTEEEIAERRVELERRLGQTPALRAQENDAKEAAKAAKDAVKVHLNQIEAWSAVTKQGYENREVECITVLEQRGGFYFSVVYRCDTGEEVSKKEASKNDLQESIPGT